MQGFCGKISNIHAFIEDRGKNPILLHCQSNVEAYPRPFPAGDALLRSPVKAEFQSPMATRKSATLAF